MRNQPGMTSPKRPRPARWQAALLAAGGGLLLVGCGSSSTSSPSPSPSKTVSPSMSSPSASGTAAAALCGDITSLRVSLQNLTTLSINAASAAKIQADLINVQNQLNTLKTMAGSEFEPEIQSLTSSLDEIKSAAAGMSATPSSAQVSKLTQAISGLKSKASSMIAELKAICPTSTSTPVMPTASPTG